MLDQAGLDTLDNRARRMVEGAVAAQTETAPGANAPPIRPGLLPDPAEVARGIRRDLSEL